MGVIPDQGIKIPHALGILEQLSLCTATTEPTSSRTLTPQLEGPCTARKDPYDTTEIRHPTTKAWRSQINKQIFSELNSIYHLTVSKGRRSGHSLAWCLRLQVSHWDATELSARAAVSSESLAGRWVGWRLFQAHMRVWQTSILGHMGLSTGLYLDVAAGSPRWVIWGQPPDGSHSRFII